MLSINLIIGGSGSLVYFSSKRKSEPQLLRALQALPDLAAYVPPGQQLRGNGSAAAE